MTTMTDTEKELLTPYANAIADIFAKIEALDGEELAALTKACDAPNSTNCWWAIKKAADLLKPLIADEYGRRTTAEIKKANDAFQKARPHTEEEGS